MWRSSSEASAWHEHLAVPSVAEFEGHLVRVRNVRNFRYGPREEDRHPAYYDAVYDLDQLVRAWFIVEPFEEVRHLAHSIISFEFTDGKFLSVSIEARTKKDRAFSILKGLYGAYPLMYVAADERDVVLLRTNLRKDRVYAYPFSFSPEETRTLLVDILSTMNKLPEDPEWYSMLFANCTSRIFYHMIRLWPGRFPRFSVKMMLTAYSDEFALRYGLLDTDLTIAEARKKYLITEHALRVGDVPDYSLRIREHMRKTNAR